MFNTLRYFKTNAFTLAEVLITLGIIGVVAAITIPGLITKYKAHRLKSQYLKSYSTIQQVFKQMSMDDVSLDASTYEAKTFYKTFARYLQGVTDCGSYGIECFNIELRTMGIYKALRNDNFSLNGLLDDGILQLQDGTLLLFENPPRIQQVIVSVDLNGYYNPPNRFGYDLFSFQLIDEQLKPMGTSGTLYEGDTYCDFNSRSSYNGISCAYRVQKESDYFISLLKTVK